MPLISARVVSGSTMAVPRRRLGSRLSASSTTLLSVA